MISIILYIGAGLFSIVGGAKGWTFFAVYGLGVVAFFISNRIPVCGENMLQTIESKEERWVVAYLMPLGIPALLYVLGWLLSVINLLFTG